MSETKEHHCGTRRAGGEDGGFRSEATALGRRECRGRDRHRTRAAPSGDSRLVLHARPHPRLRLRRRLERLQDDLHIGAVQHRSRRLHGRRRLRRGDPRRSGCIGRPGSPSPWAAVAATIIGSIIAFPFARLRTVYYAMGTLFLGYVIMNLITAGGKTTGMSTGLGGVQPLFSSRTHYYYLGLGSDARQPGLHVQVRVQPHRRQDEGRGAIAPGGGERRHRGTAAIASWRSRSAASSRVSWAPSTVTTRESPHRAATALGRRSGSSCTCSSAGSTASGAPRSAC